MNREIKFRVWDKDKKYWMKLSVTGKDKGDDIDAGWPDWESPDGVNSGLSLDYFILHKHEHRYCMQQYTGLKDKNGREIYEGDIIKGPHNFGPGGWHERAGVVNFHELHGYSWEYWDTKEIEVIGNIFENPELF